MAIWRSEPADVRLSLGDFPVFATNFEKLLLTMDFFQPIVSSVSYVSAGNWGSIFSNTGMNEL